MFLTSTYNLCFEQKFVKYQNFYLKTFSFFLFLVKFSIYLNRHVFVHEMAFGVYENSKDTVEAAQHDKNLITKIYLYNIDPLKPDFYIVKLGFTGVYIIFLISAQKHRLWVPVRTASARRF